MTPLDHLVAALVQLEQQAQEIEHRQSYIRSAIESFGIDADDALLVAVNADDEVPSFEPDSEVVDQLARLRAERLAEVAEPEQPEADDLVGLSYRVPGTKQWDWQSIGNEITLADDFGWRRVKHLQDAIGVSPATAQWMVKRCRELSLIDVERPKFDQQKARDAAAAAI